MYVLDNTCAQSYILIVAVILVWALRFYSCVDWQNIWLFLLEKLILRLANKNPIHTLYP